VRLGRRRTYDEGVGRCLKGTETGTNNEHGTTEATERPLDTAGPEEQSSYTVDAETGDEGPSISKLADNPATVCQRANEVGSEVCTIFVSGVTETGKEQLTLEDQKTARQ